MEYYDANLNGKLRKIVTIALIVAAVVFLIGFSLHIYVQVTEIQELGGKFLTVFWTNFVVRAIAQAISFAISFVLFYISTCVVRRVMKETQSPVLSVIDKLSGRILICVVLSVIASTFISETVYSRYLMFVNSTSFGAVDPIFGNDISYYIFQRPFLDALVSSVSSVWIVVTVYCVLSYVVIYAVNGLLDFQKITYNKPVIIHNIVNVVIVFAIQAITYKFRSEEILYSSIGEVAGAGYTDIYIWYNFYRVAPFLLIAIVALSLVLMAKSKYKAMIASIAAYPAILLVVAISAFCVQKLIVMPNEAVKELPYLQHNMTYTKMAYNISDVRQEEYPAEVTLNSEVIERNKDTFDSIRITDFNSTITAVNSLQGIRNYYKFNDSDVTKYNIGGKPTLVSIAPREIDKNFLPESAKSYANEVFRFTHGFGVVMNPLNEVTEEGQPKFYIKDIPAVSEEGAPEVTQPRIYYGEMQDSYVVVNSNLSEIDYYEGSEEVEYSYEGTGGIRLNFFNKLIYSVKNTDFRMLISQYATGDSKLLINRNIKERVEKAAPFLQFDNDPYMIVDGEGRLKWIIDGYTSSTYFPYSQTYNGVNYIRNSVKAVVDAYDGNIDLYVVDNTDPIIQTYMKIYPGVFIDEPMPDDIREHIVYPEYLFNIQAQVYAKYHVTNPNTLYNKSDLWAFAKEKYGSEEQAIVPYYNLMNVTEFAGEEDFIIMVPYTLANKDNMVAWLAASCDADNYGSLVSYHFPKGKNVYGTMQIENRIDSDPAISREMTLWGQGGSNVIRGNILVVPIEGALIYIEPIYISSNTTGGTASGSIPELKRVIVAYGDKIVMEATLDEALKAIFENGAPSDPAGLPDDKVPPATEKPSEEIPTEYPDNTGDADVTLEEAIDKVIKGYYDAQHSSANGDWNGFGTNMQALDEAIKELEKFRSATTSTEG